MATREGTVAELGDPRGATNEATYGPYAVLRAVWDDVTGDVSAVHVVNSSAVRSVVASAGTDGPPKRSYGPFTLGPNSDTTQPLPANIHVTLNPITGEIDGGWNVGFRWA
jgi:hypothetical protein